MQSRRSPRHRLRKCYCHQRRGRSREGGRSDLRTRPLPPPGFRSRLRGQRRAPGAPRSNPSNGRERRRSDLRLAQETGRHLRWRRCPGGGSGVHPCGCGSLQSAWRSGEFAGHSRGGSPRHARENDAIGFLQSLAALVADLERTVPAKQPPRHPRKIDRNSEPLDGSGYQDRVRFPRRSSGCR